MKKFLLKNITSVITILIIILTTILTASAVEPGHYGHYTGDRLSELTQEEILNETWWEVYYSSISGRNDPFVTSVMRQELVSFVSNFESKPYDEIRDIKAAYNDYISEKYSELTIEPGENDTYIEYENDKPDKTITFTYDEEKRMYIGRDKNGKIQQTFNRYFPEEDDFISQGTDDEGSSSKSANSSSEIAVSGNVSTEMKTYNSNPTEETEAIQEQDNNSNSQTVILIIILIAIAVCIVTIIIIKRKDD